MSAVPVVCWLDWKFRPCVAPAPFPPGAPVTRLKTVWLPNGRMSYPAAPTLMNFQTSTAAPPRKCVLRPSVVYGRRNSRESEVVLEKPASRKGITWENVRSTRFVQSKVARPVLRPSLLSPSGADPATTEAKLTDGCRYFHRTSTEGFPNPLPDVALAVELDAFTI